MPKSEPRETGYQRLMRKLHAHQFARLFEFLFWGIPGGLILVGTWFGWRVGFMSDAIAMLVAIVGLCLVGWGLLPPKKPKVKPSASPKSKRASK